MGILAPIFENYSNDFEYTTTGIFWRIVSPDCPKCGYRMNHNGYNEHYKKGLGSVKIGRYVCPICEEPLEEARDFWEQLKTDFFNVINSIYQRLRTQNASYQGASAVMKLIFPRGKDTIHNDFTNSVERADILPIEDIQIVHYDEQHPKIGRTQKFRLTLLDGVNGSPRAIHRCHCPQGRALPADRSRTNSMTARVLRPLKPFSRRILIQQGRLSS